MNKHPKRRLLAWPGYVRLNPFRIFTFAGYGGPLSGTAPDEFRPRGRRMNALRLIAKICLALLLFSLSSSLLAQTQTTGDLVGTVTDPVGALIPSAKVTLKDEARGAAIDTVTNAS